MKISFFPSMTFYKLKIYKFEKAFISFPFIEKADYISFSYKMPLKAYWRTITRYNQANVVNLKCNQEAALQKLDAEHLPLVRPLFLGEDSWRVLMY